MRTRGAAATGPGVGLLLVSLAGVVWGTIGPVVRVVHDGSGLSVLTVSAYRALVAVAVLLLAVAVTGRVRGRVAAAVGQWRRVVVVGVLTAAFQLLFFLAVPAAGVSVSTVLCMGFAPVLLLVVTTVRRRRPPPVGRASTVALAVVGLVLVTAVGGGRGEATDPVLGVLAALGAGAAFGLSADVASPLSRRLDPLTATTAVMSVAAAVLVPCGLGVAALGTAPLWTADGTSWLLVGYLGVVTMALAHGLMITGLRSTPSGAAVVATLLEPVTAVVIAASFLDERLTVAGVVGCLLIVAAIATSGRAEQTAEQPSH